MTRTTTATLAPVRNSGPALAAIGIAFSNDPDILAALAGILVIGNIVPIVIAGAIAKRRTAPGEDASDDTSVPASPTATIAS